MKSFMVGSSRVTKVHEIDLPGFAITQLLPDLDPLLPSVHPEWFLPGTYDQTGHAILSVHSWLVEHDGVVMLIDTGAGADKSRPSLPALDHLHQPFLNRLRAFGVAPDQIDYILLTHLHADHVGWNTRLRQGKWRPTFPNASVICSGIEWSYSAALARGDEDAVARIREMAGVSEATRVPTPGVFDDSLRPLAEAGRVRLIEIDGGDIMPGVRFISSRGHSIDHAVIEISSAGETGIFGGDIMHHPVEVFQPELVSMFCEFPELSRSSRRQVLEQAASRDVLYFSSHFGLTSAGRIAAKGDSFHWEFQDER